MKRTCFLFVLSAALLSFTTCQRDFVPESLDSKYTALESTAPSQGEINTSFFVSEEDIQSYIRYKSLASKREIVVTDITPIKDADDNTLLYIINYDDGWDLLAADKRATIPLGTAPNGSLYLENNDCPIVSWVHCLAEDVCITRETESIQSKTPEIVEYNLDFWKSITADPSLFAEILNEFFSLDQTRDPSFPFVPYPNGHYELLEVNNSIVFVDSLPHLIPLKWKQRGCGCNDYVPWRTDSTDLRAPAGCVAVAGAQMLYYLNTTLGMPTEAPTSAYCWGSVDDPDYLWDQYNYSSTAWAQMDSLGGPKAGMLIAAVAKMVNMDFGNNTSIAFTSDLPDDCFINFGIASTYSTYDDDTIQSALLDEMPTIVRADGHYNGWFSYGGHSFIIDGYYRNRQRTTYVYAWVWDDNDPNAAHPRIPMYTEIVNYSPFFAYYFMNWGWGDDYRNSRFAVSGDWQVGNSNYIYDREMVYDFSTEE